MDIKNDKLNLSGFTMLDCYQKKTWSNIWERTRSCTNTTDKLKRSFHQRFLKIWQDFFLPRPFRLSIQGKNKNWISSEYSYFSRNCKLNNSVFFAKIFYSFNLYIHSTHWSCVKILWDNFRLISPPELHDDYVHYKCARIEYF